MHSTIMGYEFGGRIVIQVRFITQHPVNTDSAKEKLLLFTFGCTPTPRS